MEKFAEPEEEGSGVFFCVVFMHFTSSVDVITDYLAHQSAVACGVWKVCLCTSFPSMYTYGLH